MIWDSITGNCCQILQAHYKSGITALSHSIEVSRDKKESKSRSWLVTGISDGSIKIWRKSNMY